MSGYLGHQIDNYRVLRLLGSGSFGEVYLAEHVIHGTQFAIKLLKERLDKQTALSNFLNEARVFRLEHPNIMRIRDFGIADDIPFLVMDYVPGGTLRGRHPAMTRVALKTVVDYVNQMSEALQYAHNEGLVHRDVKPENMLIGARGEILLSDFGIVTSSHTWNPAQVHGVAGTILYMAPEQINAHPVRASDQYALAAIVYEWLVGRPPFLGTVPEVLMHHVSVAPSSLREFVPTIPQEVERVVLKGLMKDARKRFATIREFAEALEQASKPPIGTTLYSFEGHTDWVTGVAWSSNGIRVASGSNDTTVQIWNTEKEQVFRVYHGHMRAVTGLAWSPDNKCIVSASLDHTAHVWSVMKGQKLQVYEQHTDDIFAVSWAPDGVSIASAGADRTIHIWNAGTCVRYMLYREHMDDICAVAWSPNGKYIASAGYDTLVHVREVATGTILFSYHSHLGGVYALSWSPDSRRIASASYDKTVQVREVATGNLMFTYTGHTEGVFAVAWSPDGTRIASGSDDKTVRVWQYPIDHTLVTYEAHTEGVRCIAWSPDGQRIASGGVDKVVHVWQAS